MTHMTLVCGVEHFRVWSSHWGIHGVGACHFKIEGMVFLLCSLALHGLIHLMETIEPGFESLKHEVT